MAGPPLGARAAWAFVAAAVAVLAAAALPLAREAGAGWRGYQRDWARATGRPAPGVREIAPAGAPERCPTCHLGMQAGAEAAARAQPLRPHPAILAQHPPERDGCVSCHGGAGRPLDRRAAHPASGPDELRRGPLLAAGCPRCHVPGSVAGDRAVVDGLEVFVDLGCITCHRAGRVDATSEFGPDLSTVGRRGSAYLRRVVKEPSKLFPGTKMPDFGPALAAPGREDALVTFLLSLRGEPSLRRERDGASAWPCALCHGGGPPTGRPHRCVYLRERRADFACARCHGATPPRSARECPYVLKRRFICGACHEASHG